MQVRFEDENILAITMQRAKWSLFEYICGLFIFLIFSSSVIYFCLLSNYKDIDIFCDKNSRICKVKQSIFPFSQTKTVNLVSGMAVLQNISGKTPRKFVQLPLLSNGDPIVVGHSLCGHDQKVLWLQGEFNKLNNDKSLKSFHINLKSSDFFNLSLFSIELLCPLYLFLLLLLYLFCTPIKSQIIINKKEKTLGYYVYTLLSLLYSDSRRYEIKISEIREVKTLDTTKIVPNTIFIETYSSPVCLNSNKLLTFYIKDYNLRKIETFQYNPKKTRELIDLIKNFIELK